MLVLEGPGPGESRQRLREDLQDEQTMLASAEISVDGKQWTNAFSATYRRIG